MYTKHVSILEIRLQWEYFCKLGFIEHIREVLPSFVLLEVQYERDGEDIFLVYEVESLFDEDEVRGMRVAGHLFNAWRGLFGYREL